MRILFFIFILFLSLISSAFGAQNIFNLGIGSGAEYTDNVYLTNDGKASDVILYVTPQATWDFSTASRMTRFSFSPSFRNYAKNTEPNVIYYNASSDLSLPVTRSTYFEFSDTYFLTDDPAENVDDNTIRKSREIYYRNSTTMGLNSQFGRFDSVYINCAYIILRNDDPAFQDSDQFTPSAGIAYRFLPDWLLRFDAAYTFGEFEKYGPGEQEDDFDNIKATLRMSKQLTHFMDAFVQYSHTFMRYKGPTEDYDVFDPSVGISITVDDEPIFSILIGYYFLDRRDSEDEGGLTFSGNLGRRFRFKKGSVGLSGSSGYEESYFGAENLGFDVYHEVMLTFLYELAKNVSFNVSGMARHDRYRNTLSKRVDMTGQVNTGLKWFLNDWIDVTVSYQYKTVDVTQAVIANSSVTEDYKENRVVIEVFLTPTSGRNSDL